MPIAWNHSKNLCLKLKKVQMAQKKVSKINTQSLNYKKKNTWFLPLYSARFGDNCLKTQSLWWHHMLTQSLYLIKMGFSRCNPNIILIMCAINLSYEVAEICFTNLWHAMSQSNTRHHTVSQSIIRHNKVTQGIKRYHKSSRYTQ